MSQLSSPYLSRCLDCRLPTGQPACLGRGLGAGEVGEPRAGPPSVVMTRPCAKARVGAQGPACGGQLRGIFPDGGQFPCSRLLPSCLAAESGGEQKGTGRGALGLLIV